MMNKEKGTFTHQEILSQPEAWAAALEVLAAARRGVLDLAPARRYGGGLFTGCGSTYDLSPAAFFRQMTRRLARAAPGSKFTWQVSSARPVHLLEGEIELHGLQAGRSYRLDNYETETKYGAAHGPVARLSLPFKHHLLLQASTLSQQPRYLPTRLFDSWTFGQ